MREQFPERGADYLTDFDLVEVTPDDNWHAAIFSKMATTFKLPSPALTNLLKFSQESLKCQSVLIEPYVSTDFADEYSTFYSRVFGDVPRLCKRLHFFRGLGSENTPLRKVDLLNLSTCAKRAYLGYSVVRPTTPLFLGDTVLASPHQREHLDLVHCQSKFDVHLLGHTLSVHGMPFLAQDTEVGVCADADLWMVARYMHTIGECRRYRPSEVHELATRGLFQGPAREGLVHFQMMDALRGMGLTPDMVYSVDPDETIELLYSCVESEIPVIVGLPRHVVTVIGHGYVDKMEFANRRFSMASCVNGFVAHDDACQPYRWMPISKKDGPKGGSLFLADQPVEWCIFPAPPRVNLRHSDVVKLFRNWLLFLKNNLENNFLAPSNEAEGGKPGSWWKADDFDDLVTREYLRRNDRFKADIYPPEDEASWSDEKFIHRPLELVLRYWCQRLPKYVWVIEFARRSHLEGKSPLDRKIVGEAIFDATAHRYDPFNSLLAFHLDDRVLLRNPPGSAAPFEQLALALHNPYNPLLRRTK